MSDYEPRIVTKTCDETPTFSNPRLGYFGEGFNVIQRPPTTLPTESSERKDYPLLDGALRYFPAAIAGVAFISKTGNDKHNPGQPLHHARNKSMDHGNCILRHIVDVEDLLAAQVHGYLVTKQQILEEVNQMAWRALAYSQAIHEQLGAPLAPAAKLVPPESTSQDLTTQD